MSHLLARKPSDSAMAAQSSNTPSDQKPQEARTAPYRDARYETFLATKGTFMRENPRGISVASKHACRVLLESPQSHPWDTIFSDEIFEETCYAIQNKTEARVIRDISLLIVPSAETLAIRDHEHLGCLIESVDEAWDNSIPLTAPRPQPHYAVGFRRQAFTDKQLEKLQPFVGGLFDRSFFKATYYLYFPFLTCEVKGSGVALDVADRQNAHSMALALRGVVELFRLVNRENELDGEIIAFSISHDNRSVRIHGHYPIIEDTETTFYRHTIRVFDFTELQGREKWTTYKFIKNLYDIWMPAHFTRLCSVIDTLSADVNFDLSVESDLYFPERPALSQNLEDQNLSALNADSALSAQGENSPLQPPGSPAPLDTSFTTDSVRGGKGRAKSGCGCLEVHRRSCRYLLTRSISRRRSNQVQH